ncbi:HMI004Wp (mitochondrion) [Eremothecium sinecaudum]|uniref:Small ribosomal subunit protein uS3m n=1 Tax=Eremothecium sinecaudum TaxID=45286 RepID=A0A120K2Y7_9SACH|nr:HMI004Wp [Eremothecium sinecaudum]AMD23028.1 HMI004Wp [Eremothecium sinecaudum]
MKHLMMKTKGMSLSDMKRLLKLLTYSITKEDRLKDTLNLSTIQQLNSRHDWSIQSYSSNNQSWMRTWFMTKMITKLLENMIRMRSNQQRMLNIYISDIMYEKSTNKLNIKFFYYTRQSLNNTNNNYNRGMLWKWTTLMLYDPNNIRRILSSLLGMDVSLEMIRLRYWYSDTSITTQVVKETMTMRMMSMMRLKRMMNRLPKFNTQLMSKEYNNYMMNLNELGINDLMTILSNKYNTGYTIQVKGRVTRQMRTKTISYTVGTFKHSSLVIKDRYKLNRLPHNHTISSRSYTNKNGRYNIKVKLNVI